MKTNEFSDTFFVLDFDRCTADTEKFHTVLESVIERETSITPDEIRQAKDEIERIGGTFDSAMYIRQLLAERQSDKTWLGVQRAFIESAQREDMLMPHTRELLGILDEKNIPYGIVTYGSESWQLAKLEAADVMDVPHIVTQIQNKGEILTGWKHGDEFIIPPALTRNFRQLAVKWIVFLDDKAVSFQGIPAGVRGVHVLPSSGERLPSQQGELPASVTDVVGIAGAIDLLFRQEADS